MYRNQSILYELLAGIAYPSLILIGCLRVQQLFMIDTTAICPQIINNTSTNWIVLVCKRGGKPLWAKIIHQNTSYESANQLQPYLELSAPVGTGRKGWVMVWGVGIGVLSERGKSCTRNSRTEGLQNQEVMPWEDRAGVPVLGSRWV